MYLEILVHIPSLSMRINHPMFLNYAYEIFLMTSHLETGTTNKFNLSLNTSNLESYIGQY